MMNKSIVIFLTFLITVSIAGLVIAEVNGAGTVTEVNDFRGTADAPGSNAALAGNVTELTIAGQSLTQSWQGYFGNVSGAIELTNAAGNVLYNWSLASPQGEVFASNSSSVTWDQIDCFNVTANGTGLESTFGIGVTDVDGVNETFSNASAHDAFTVGSTSFAADACFAAFIFDSTGASVDNNFEQVLLTDGTYNESVVYAAILEEDLAGFDGATHDFEMIVLEDGHNGDVATTTYYFYVELE